MIYLMDSYFTSFQKSESIKNLALAQIQIQKHIKDIAKDSKGYGYNYTSLDKLLQYVRPLLADYGIAFIQMPVGNENEVGIETLYIHPESGEWISNAIVSPLHDARGMNIYQSAGCAITYFRRYSLSSFIGIASEDDTDAVTDTVSKQSESQVDKHFKSLKEEDDKW